MIVTADSVTDLADVEGKVLVAGSHAGRIAAHYSASAGVRAVILHDAGIGLDEAGISGLPWLDGLGIPAAAVDHASARIGDGADVLANGVVSTVNRAAAALGVKPGMRTHTAALLLVAAPCRRVAVPAYVQGRSKVAPGVWALDSLGLVVASDAGKVLVIGSHGALHGGRPESALAVQAALAAFHDAGGGACSRLPALQERGTAAVTVGAMSARIGDGRSMWQTGVVSQFNRLAGDHGIEAGMALRVAIERFSAARKNA